MPALTFLLALIMVLLRPARKYAAIRFGSLAAVESCRRHGRYAAFKARRRAARHLRHIVASRRPLPARRPAISSQYRPATQLVRPAGAIGAMPRRPVRATGRHERRDRLSDNNTTGAAPGHRHRWLHFTSTWRYGFRTRCRRHFASHMP